MHTKIRSFLHQDPLKQRPARILQWISAGAHLIYNLDRYRPPTLSILDPALPHDEHLPLSSQKAGLRYRPEAAVDPHFFLHLLVNPQQYQEPPRIGTAAQTMSRIMGILAEDLEILMVQKTTLLSQPTRGLEPMYLPSPGA